MMTPASPLAPTAGLADELAARRTAILANWREAVAADPELITSAGLSRGEFIDHIPFVLDDLERRLRVGTAGGTGNRPTTPTQTGEKPPSAAHGHRRWTQGYDLREVILEWGHFQGAVLRTLEDFHGAADPAVLAAARAELARAVNEGIADNAEQYARLQGQDAAARVHDLERTLAEINAAGRRRAESWREGAHDLRGQLNIIVSATALLDDPTLPGPMRDESFDMLKKGVRSLHKMLTDLLDAARRQAGRESLRVEPFDAAALLGTLCAAAQPFARERGLRLVADGPESLPVQGDRGKVQRIAQNLLLNALRYTERGEVTLGWAGDDAESWSFRVRDTGPGLPEAVRLTALMREPRSRSPFPDRPAPPTPPPAPGEGIGLSIVQRLGSLVRAQLEIETDPGQGTTFRVLLPRHYPQEEGEE